MKNTNIIVVMAALALATFLCGCASSSKQKFVIHDTVYDDYYSKGQWSQDKADADRMSYLQAKLWLQDWRVNERGEYANTGAVGYPVKIEPED